MSGMYIENTESTKIVQLLEEIHDCRLMMCSTYEKVNEIVRKVNKQDARAELQRHMPFSTIEYVKQIEEWLKQNGRQNLILLTENLQEIWAENAITFIRKSLRRMFTDDVARACSWHGRKGKYRIRCSVFLEAVKNAVTEKFPTNDCNLDEVVMHWFRVRGNLKTAQKIEEEAPSTYKEKFEEEEEEEEEKEE